MQGKRFFRQYSASNQYGKIIDRLPAKKRGEIIDKLAAKIASALEKPCTVGAFPAFTFFKSIVQTLPRANRSATDVGITDVEVTSLEVTGLEDCPVVATIQAQERGAILRRLFAKIASSLKRLLHAGASQGASTRLVNLVHKAGTETWQAIWRRGTRVIRNISEGCLPSSLPEIVSILQVANAMRSTVPASYLVCSRKE